MLPLASTYVVPVKPTCKSKFSIPKLTMRSPEPLGNFAPRQSRPSRSTVYKGEATARRPNKGRSVEAVTVHDEFRHGTGPIRAQVRGVTSLEVRQTAVNSHAQAPGYFASKEVEAKRAAFDVEKEKREAEESAKREAEQRRLDEEAEAAAEVEMAAAKQAAEEAAMAKAAAEAEAKAAAQKAAAEAAAREAADDALAAEAAAAAEAAYAATTAAEATATAAAEVKAISNAVSDDMWDDEEDDDEAEEETVAKAGDELSTEEKIELWKEMAVKKRQEADARHAESKRAEMSRGPARGRARKKR